MAPQINQVLTAYVNIRGKIEDVKRKHKEELAEYADNLEMLEKHLEKFLTESGQEGVKAGGHTAYFTTKDSVKVSDKDTFKMFLSKQFLLTFQPHLYLTTQNEWQPDGQRDLKEHSEKMMKSEAFDLITLSASKTNCKTYMEDNAGIMPDGVDYTAWKEVAIRKGTKK